MMTTMTILNGDGDDHSKVVKTVTGVETSTIAWLALSARLIMIMIMMINDD